MFRRASAPADDPIVKVLDDFPFSYPASLLAVLMAIAAAIDFRRNGRFATRYKDYAFIWLTGLLGCLIGGANDLITSSISPEYFAFGKGLPGGEGFKLRVALFGMKEGLSAGVIAGAICIYVSRRKSAVPPLEFVEALRLLWIPIAGAIAGAILSPVMFLRFDPMNLRSKLDGVVISGQINQFRRVWWIHTGLYSGFLAGLCCIIAIVLRRRRPHASTASG